jgi:hypothetical protein
VKEFMKFPDRTISSPEAIESFFEEEEKKLVEIEADELLARSFGVILFFNSLSDSQKAGVLDRLLKYLKELKKKLDGIAKDWGVSNYKIGVSFTGVQLSLTFETKETNNQKPVKSCSYFHKA